MAIRALTGSQKSGHAFVGATLDAIFANDENLLSDVSARTALYTVFHTIWLSTWIDVPEPADPLDSQDGQDGHDTAANTPKVALTPVARQALLLTVMEGFSDEEAARILGLQSATLADLVEQAIDEIDRQTSATVLIIEDEPIIAADMAASVDVFAHRVVAIADNRTDAVKAALSNRPRIVLADIQLSDGSSGIDAVDGILSLFEVPVIFVTAHPERLLTGERLEPAFCLTKPFRAESLKVCIRQALFFNSVAQFA